MSNLHMKSHMYLTQSTGGMAMNNSSSTPEVPELGVPLKQGYNGDLTSRQNGSVGGEMVRRMIKRQEEQMSGNGNL